MAKSMQLMLFSTFIVTTKAGLWSSISGLLSMRIPDEYDLDLRKAVQKDFQELDLFASVEHRAPSAVVGSHTESDIAKSTVSAPGANITEELTMATLTMESKGEVRPRRRQRRKNNAEANLINSLRHMGEKGEEAVVCVTTCRFGESVRHEWRECLERCVENPLMRSTFLSMLPAEHHKAHVSSVEMPDILKERLERKRQRSAEL
mmetsp:Transcript_84649/g.163237  ORF Transcript_84649/g.163237 Transcript_84649/m.163237 type:complete len:205 (-) Transcript_84649:98-712(-)